MTSTLWGRLLAGVEGGVITYQTWGESGTVAVGTGELRNAGGVRGLSPEVGSTECIMDSTNLSNFQ